MSKISTLAAAHNWNIPLVCPVCGSEFNLSDNHCKCQCSNDYCPSKFAGRINKWTNVHEIKEFGNKTINTLIENGIIDSISSLYSLDLKKIQTKISGIYMHMLQSTKNLAKLGF